MAELPKPLNVLELQDGESRRFTVTRFEQGEETIFPGHAPQGKKIQVLRVHVRPEDVEHAPYYWDITSSRLVAQLRPQLALVGNLTVRWQVTAHGIAPKKYFTVERAPA